MRGLRRIIMVTGLMFFVLNGCDEDGSPTGPGDEGIISTSLSGAVLTGFRSPTSMQVRIVGDAVDTTLVMQSNGFYPGSAEFRYDGIPSGQYTIIPTPYDNFTYVPENMTVDVNEGHTDTDPFFVIDNIFFSFLKSDR